MDEQGYQREGRSGGKHLSLGLFFFWALLPSFAWVLMGGLGAKTK